MQIDLAKNFTKNENTEIVNAKFVFHKIGLLTLTSRLAEFFKFCLPLGRFGRRKFEK